MTELIRLMNENPVVFSVVVSAYLAIVVVLVTALIKTYKS